jgi:hypothetical protein
VVIAMTALTAGTRRGTIPEEPALHGPSSSRTDGPAATDRSAAAARPRRTVRSWPLLVLAAPAAAEVWSGWVGIAQKTGFGLVSPLPGIWPSLHLDTTITLPVGVEAYAAYALRAWLGSRHHVSPRTRRFAKWSAICSFTLGMAGQVAYHLLAQAGVARAPWPITTLVSCLPVLVLGMGTALAHMLHADAEGVDRLEGRAKESADVRSPMCCPADRIRLDQDQAADRQTIPGSARTVPHGTQPQMDRARLLARRLAAAGKPLSRRALRSGGVKGSNESLGALARKVNAELAGHTTRSGLTTRPGQGKAGDLPALNQTDTTRSC